MNTTDLGRPAPPADPYAQPAPPPPAAPEPLRRESGGSPVAIVALVVIGFAVAAFALLIATGFIRFNVEGEAQAPRVEVSGGSAPEVQMEMGRIGVTTEERTVEVPRVEVERPPEKN
jgi:hypothetical protein